MDRDTAVTRISDGLGFRTDLADKIILRMQEAQRDLERGKTLPWFLLVEDEQLTLSASSNVIALPDDFLRLAEDESLRYRPSSSSTSYAYVPRRSFDEGLSAYQSASAAAPRIYVLRTESLYIYPSSDAAYTLYWSYYARGASLTSNVADGDTPWLDDRYVPELLIGRAGQKMARDLGDQVAAGIFDQMARDAWDAVFRETIIREEAARDRRLGRNT